MSPTRKRGWQSHSSLARRAQCQALSPTRKRGSESKLLALRAHKQNRRLNTMNTTHLTFLWTPWSAALSNAVVLLAGVLCWLAWRRSGYARSQGLLELLRLSIVALTALILNQPEWVEEFRPVEKPGVLVLW